VTLPEGWNKRRVTIKIRRRRFEEDDEWLDPKDRWGPEIKWVIEWRAYYVEDTELYEAGQCAGGVDDTAETYEEAWRIADRWIREAERKGWEIGHG
jgi:hypothetical protein